MSDSSADTDNQENGKNESQETPMVCLETTSIEVYDTINFVYLSDSLRSYSGSRRDSGCVVWRIPRPATDRTSKDSWQQHLYGGVDGGGLLKDLDLMEEARDHRDWRTATVCDYQETDHFHCSQQAPCHSGARAQGPIRHTWMLNTYARDYIPLLVFTSISCYNCDALTIKV